MEKAKWAPGGKYEITCHLGVSAIKDKEDAAPQGLRQLERASIP
jgi:hypothetical protein